MSQFDETRALLRPHVSALAGDHHLRSKLRLRGTRSTSDLLTTAKKTWIAVDLDSASPGEIEQLRALVEVVGQLSKAPDFQWREFYYSFWKEALMDQLVCRIRCAFGCSGNPVPTEFDNFERLMESDGPRFLLDLSKCVLIDNKFEPLRSFLFASSQEAMGKEHSEKLAKLTGRDRRRNDDHGSSKVPNLIGKEPSLPRMPLGLALPTHGLTTSQYRALSELLGEFTEQEQEKKPGDNVVWYKITALWIPSKKPLEPIDMEILTSQMPTIRHLHFEDL